MTASSSPNGASSILDLLPVGVLILDGGMYVRHWNACLQDWTNIAAESIIGTDVRQRFAHLGEPPYRRRLQDLCAGGAPSVFSSQLHPHLIQAPLHDGRLRVLHTLAAPMPADDGDGFWVLLTLQDVTDLSEAMTALRQARDDAQQQAATDALTGISNRRHFMQLLHQRCALWDRRRSPSALLLLDLDGFKAINDTRGHPAGDFVLREFAVLCRRLLREYDVPGRLGGDEFAVLLPEADLASAIAIADRLRRAAYDHHFVCDGQNLRIAISIGAITVSEEAHTPEDMLRRAYEALYEAKRLGKNRVVSA